MRNLFLPVLLYFLVSSATAQFNNSAHFFGNEGYIKVQPDSSLQMSEEITMEAWVKVDSFHTSQIGIAGTWDDNIGNLRTYFLWIRNEIPEFLISTNGSSFQRVVGTQLQAGIWYHLACTFDGSKISFYRNDTLDAEVTLNGPIATNNRPFYIGRTETGSNGPDHLYGSIDELRVWNKARSAEQIRHTSKDTLNNAYYSSKDSGLVAYYRFDQVTILDSVGTVKDFSVENNTGEVIGKVEFDSSVIITNITNKNRYYSAKDFQLNQNYPNPFNPKTTISYTLTKSFLVNLTIFSIDGKKIKTLVNTTQQPGNHNITFDASKLTSGVYIYRIRTSTGFLSNRKMIVIK